MDFIESIPYLMGQIATAYKVNFDKKLKEIDLHGGQVFILLQLWKKEGLTQIQIANELNLSAPTINKMIKSLIERDYLSCRQCQQDTRQTRVFLTQKGKEIKEQVSWKWTEIENNLLTDFSETEKLILFQLFEKLNNNLQNFS